MAFRSLLFLTFVLITQNIVFINIHKYLYKETWKVQTDIKILI